MSFYAPSKKKQGSKAGGFYGLASQKDEGLERLLQLQSQVANTQTRLDHVGEKTDTRNPLEKLLNLPEKQNFLYDILDVIQRPFQAVTNMASTRIDPNDVRSLGEAAKDGISGKNKVFGSDLLEQGGVEGWKKHVGGFGIDVLLDPLTYIPAGQIAKGAQMAGRGVKAITPMPVQKLAQKGSDAIGSMFKTDAKALGRTLEGEHSDFIVERMRQASNELAYGTGKIVDDMTAVFKEAGLNKETFNEAGKQVARLMEDALVQFEKYNEFRMPDGTIIRGEKEFKAIMKGYKDELRGFQKYVKSQERSYSSSIASAEKAVSESSQIMKDIINNAKKGIEVADPKELNRLAREQAMKNPDFIKAEKERALGRQNVEALKAEQALKLATFAKTTDEMGGVLADFEKSLKEPIKMEVRIERLKQEATKDPALVSASEKLIEGNQYLMQMAKEKGLKVNDMAGYMAHILTNDALNFMRKQLSSGKRKVGGNPNVVKERTLKGSAEEINLAQREKMMQEFGEEFAKEHGYDMFVANGFVATALGQKRFLNYIVAESAKKDILGNADFARPLGKGELFVPTGDHVLIKSSDYDLFKMDKLSGSVDGIMDDGTQYVVTKGVKKALEQYQIKTQDDGIRNFMKTYDKIHDTWKKFALFSAGFHVRNQVGNNFNMWIAGMSGTDLVKYNNHAIRDLRLAKNGKGSPMYEDFKKQGLRESGIYEQEFKHGDGEQALMRKLGMANQNKANPVNLMNTAFDKSRDFGTFIDEHARYAMFKWARDKGNSVEKAAEIVRETLFDYSKLTPLERNIKRVIPFYTWTRNNIPFQLKNMFLNPAKYSGVEKARDMAFGLTGMDEDLAPEWLQESFAFPIMGDGKGDGKFLGLNLPLADVSQLSNPFKMMTDLASPILKTPLEFGTNTDFFRGEELEQFKGQTGSVGLIDGVPKKLAHVINQLGAVRNFANHTKSAQEGDIVKIVTGNMLKDFNKEQASYFKNVHTLNDLQDALQRYKQRYGELPPTLAEIAGG